MFGAYFIIFGAFFVIVGAFFVIFGAYIIIFGPLFIMIVTSLLKEFGGGLGKTGKPHNAILPFPALFSIGYIQDILWPLILNDITWAIQLKYSKRRRLHPI